MIPNKFPKLPQKVFNQDWSISIKSNSISENGGPEILATVTAKCFYNGKSHQVMNAEKQIIRLEGTLIALGNQFPTLAEISTGTAIKGTVSYKIYKCDRPLNPDGSVYATIMELM